MKAIVSVSEENAIGYTDGRLIYSSNEDFNHFKKVTENSIVVMGRKTFEGMGNKPLKNRLNLVLSSKDIGYPFTCHSTSQVMKLVTQLPLADVIVIGGVEVYKAFIRYIDTFFVTYWDISVGYVLSDIVYLPLEDLLLGFKEVKRTKIKNGVIVKYERDYEPLDL